MTRPRIALAVVLAVLLLTACGCSAPNAAKRDASLDRQWTSIAVDLKAVKAAVSPKSGCESTRATAAVLPEVVCGPFKLAANAPTQYAVFSAAPGAKPRLVDSTAGYKLPPSLPTTVEGTAPGVLIPNRADDDQVAQVIADLTVFERQGREQLVTNIAALNAANAQRMVLGGPVRTGEQWAADSATPTSCWVDSNHSAFCGPLTSSMRPGAFYINVGDLGLGSAVTNTAAKVVWPGVLKAHPDAYVLTALNKVILPDSNGHQPTPMI
jgi:hypothetical protein